MVWAGSGLLVLSVMLWVIESTLCGTRGTSSEMWHAIRAVGSDLPEFHWFWELASHAVARDALVALSGLGILLLADRRRVQLLLVTLVTTGLLVNLLKFLVGRPRPHGDLGSWPSGHAGAAWALAVTAGIIRFRGWRFVVGFCGTAAFARIALERHWPADVVASLGLAMLTAAWAVRLPVFFPGVLCSARFMTALAGLGWIRTAAVLPFEQSRSLPYVSWALLFWSATFLLGLQRVADEVAEPGRSA